MGGMKDEDQREHIRSIGQNGAVDIAWMEEATQFQENDYNEILARMRGVAGPFTQVILTTNPEGPMHWIYVNLIMDAHKDDRISLYQPSVYENNHNSKEYISNNLERLSGVQRSRLLEGRWVQATGLVFDNWVDNPDSDNSNVTYDADYIPGAGHVVWWIDDGVTGEMKNGVFTARSHPRAILFAQILNDGRIHIFDESYRVGRVATDHMEEMIKYSEEMGYELPNYVLRDRAAASLGAAVREMGFKDKYNPVRIEESITEMYSWIDPGESGIRRLLAHPRCRHFRNEMVNFGRNNKTGRIVKAYDHGVDAARYGIWDNVEGKPPEIDIANYYQYNYDDPRTLGIIGRPSRRRSGIDIATY
jgi:phage terminase large subunit